MNFIDVMEARKQAINTIANADNVIRQAVTLAKGRLRLADCRPNDLKEFKRELQDFNANTGKWKERK